VIRGHEEPAIIAICGMGPRSATPSSIRRSSRAARVIDLTGPRHAWSAEKRDSGAKMRVPTRRFRRIRGAAASPTCTYAHGRRLIGSAARRAPKCRMAPRPCKSRNADHVVEPIACRRAGLKVAPHRICHRAIVRMEAIFFTVESPSMMALRATAEGGAPEGVDRRPPARH